VFKFIRRPQYQTNVIILHIHIDDFTTDCYCISCLNVWLHIWQSQHLTVSTKKQLHGYLQFEFTKKLPGAHQAVQNNNNNNNRPFKFQVVELKLSTQLNSTQQETTDAGVYTSMSASNLARSANLPEGLYILPSVVSIFLSSFLMISQRQIISRSTGHIFAIFTSNESFLGVDDRSGPLFSISQGTLPWQPILCKKWQTPHFRRSGIQKRYGLTPYLCKIK